MEMIAVLIKFSVLSMVILPAMISPVSGQLVTPCTMGMLSSFTPCLGYVTGSGANGSFPTADCCSSLSSLVGSSAGCLCLILTANAPFRVPINQSLAIALPQACNMASVAVQCQDNAATLPPPATSLPRPATPLLPPSAMPPVTPSEASTPPSLPPTPQVVVSPPALPPPTTTGTGLPRPSTPSSAQLNHGFSSLSMLALLVLGSML